MGALLWRHGGDDGLHARQRLLVKLGVLEGRGLDARHHGRELLHAAHLLHLAHLLQKVVQIEFLGAQLLLHLLGLFLVKGLLRLFNERQHVAHAEDARGHAVGVEDLDVRELFPRSHEFDGLSRDVLDRKGGAAARVAVHLAHDDARDVEQLVKALCHVDGILPRHGVDHQQNLGGRHGLLEAPELVHERLVNMQAAGGVQKDHVVAVLFGVCHRALCDFHHVGLARLGIHRDAHALAHHLELVHGGRTVDVAGGQQGPLVLLPGIHAGQLGGVGGLSRALQPHHHDNGGRRGGDFELCALASHELDKLLVDNLNHLLGGREALKHFGPRRPLGDGGHKGLDHLDVDVGPQQHQAHLAHGLLDVGLGQLALAAQPLEGGRQTLRQRFKRHLPPPLPAPWRP